MKLSQLFTRTAYQVPADETSKNAQLLIKAGYIHKEMAGVYDFLPLGLMTLNNIMQVVREEMNAIGGQEVFMGSLQHKDLWQQTGRWDDKQVDIWFKSKLQSGDDVGLAWSHEEAITTIMKNFARSYKDLPAYVYQFQTKFRNEPRARSGLLRCREFIMKDLYSFSRTQDEHDEFYEKAKAAYHKIFKRLGIDSHTVLTFASGGSFAKFSHEFQTLSDVGEDTIYVSKDGQIAVNKEVYSDEVLAELGLKKADMEERQAIEVGNIFSLGTRFSDALDLTFADNDDSQKPVIMGCYGIGPARVMATIVELMADDKGLVWPESVAPFKVHLISLPGDKAKAAADELYDRLTQAGVGVIYDDRDERAGKKFADADLLGMPQRIVISDKTLAENKAEVKQRTEEKTDLVSLDSLIDNLSQQD